MTLGEYIPNSNTKLLLHLNGNSTDSSGNNNNGVDTAITYSQANGRFGQGAGFNGSSSYISVGNSASLQFGTNPFTINVWFKKAANNYTGCFYHDNSSPKVFSLGVSSDNTLFFYASDGTGVLLSSTITITDFNWHLLTVVVEATNSRKMYIDGVYNNISTTNLTGGLTGTAVKTLGRNSLGGNSEYFNGSIDEVIIENRAWSASEVKKYYTNSRGFYATL